MSVRFKCQLFKNNNVQLFNFRNTHFIYFLNDDIDDNISVTRQ